MLADPRIHCHRHHAAIMFRHIRGILFVKILVSASDLLRVCLWSPWGFPCNLCGILQRGNSLCKTSRILHHKLHGLFESFMSKSTQRFSTSALTKSSRTLASQIPGPTAKLEAYLLRQQLTHLNCDLVEKASAARGMVLASSLQSLPGSARKCVRHHGLWQSRGNALEKKC